MSDGIQKVLDQAAEKGSHAPAITVLGRVSGWLVNVARAHGIDLTDFNHIIDGSAVRHVMTRHGDAAAEAAYGQVAVTSADFHALPEVLASPDRVAFGAKGRRGASHIAFVKQRPDGSVLVIEEVRTGRKHLALLSMRKYPAAINADRLARILDPNVRSDGGDVLKIVETPPGASAIDPVTSLGLDTPGG